jgi:peptide deformylase
MTYPIVVYGSPVLRKKAPLVTPDYPNLKKFVEDLFETMEKSDGIGLAAPQVGKSVRIFVIDATALADEHPELEGFRKAFINPQITEHSEDLVNYNEGCLSLPTIREDVQRPSVVKISYVDENFNNYEETYEGVIARIIQHEYDHLDGILLIDHLNPLKRKMLEGKLKAISKGKVEVAYKIKTAV